MSRHLVSLSVAILGAVALGAACGGDDDPIRSAARSGGDTALEVVAADVKFGKDSYETPAGRIDVRYVNRGSITHTLLVQGIDEFKLKVASKGDEHRGSIELEAGTYTIYCDVPGHREAGMEATLEVR